MKITRFPTRRLLAQTGLAIALSVPMSYTVFAIEEVAVIGTRTETPLSELPSNISVLDSQALDSLSSVHIQQALSQVPGVNYQRGNGQESLPAIRSAVLTGAGACGNVLVLENGIAVRGAGFCNVNELFDTHFEHANSIEVVRGANTAFYGSNALLGSINVNLQATGENQVSLELGANDYRRAKAAISYGEPEGSHGRFYVTATDSGSFRDESGYQQQKLSWRHAAILGDWALDLGATATTLDQDTAGFIVGLDSYRDAQLRTQNLDPNAFRKTKSLRTWASFTKELEKKPTIDQRTLTVTPYFRVTDMDFLQHFLPGDPLEQNQQKGIGWQSNLTTKVSDRLTWNVGFDGEFSNGDLQQTQNAPTRGSAFLQATIPAGTHYDYTVDVQQFGAFGHVNWQFSENWHAIAGLRLEHLRYDYDNLALDGRTRDDGTECGFGGCRYSRPADRRDRFTHVSPKLELQYSATPQWRWHVAVSDSFRAPQATELYRLQRAQVVSDLDEVRATHIEAGVQWQPTNATKLSATLYQIHQRNVIIRDSDFFSVDGQSINSKGLELSVYQGFGDKWSARLVASLAEHKYASDQFSGDVNIRGNLVDTAPKVLINGSLDYQASGVLSAGLEMQHTSRYFLDTTNEHEYPGHTLFNLRGRYQISSKMSASLRLLNLADRDYAERADFTSFTDERYFPGEGRSLFAELKLKF